MPRSRSSPTSSHGVDAPCPRAIPRPRPCRRARRRRRRPPPECAAAAARTKSGSVDELRARARRGSRRRRRTPLHRLERAHAAAHLQRVRPRPWRSMRSTTSDVAGRPVAAPSRSTTWIHSAPPSANSLACADGILVVDGHALVVALSRRTALPAEDVDGGMITIMRRRSRHAPPRRCGRSWRARAAPSSTTSRDGTARRRRCPTARRRRTRTPYSVDRRRRRSSRRGPADSCARSRTRSPRERRRTAGSPRVLDRVPADVRDLDAAGQPVARAGHEAEPLPLAVLAARRRRAAACPGRCRGTALPRRRARSSTSSQPARARFARGVAKRAHARAARCRRPRSMTAGSSVTTTSATPACSKPFWTLRRLPIR